jgi:hypothetical protein
VRVLQRRALGRRHETGRLGVGRGGADENVLSTTPGEQPEVALDLRRFEGDELHDGVETVHRQRGSRRRRVADIAGQIARAGDAGAAGPVEQPEFVAQLLREPAAGGADVSGAANEKKLHGQEELGLDAMPLRRGGSPLQDPAPALQNRPERVTAA